MHLVFALRLLATADAEWKSSFDKAHLYFADAYYSEAIGLLDNIIARPDLPAKVRKEALFMLGGCHLGLGHDAAAKARYIELLSSDIDYVLPDYSPRKVRTFFETLRVSRRNLPRLLAKPPSVETTATGEVVNVTFEIERVTGERRLQVYARRTGQRAYAPVIARYTPGKAYVVIPLGILAEKSSVTVEYYARIVEGGEVLATAGQNTEPFVFAANKQVTTIVEKPVYKKAWFWTVMGLAVAGVAGAGVAVYVVTTQSSAPVLPATGSLSISYGAAR